ncbi:MAG: glycosyltransferase family 2 protein [Anaerolineae bacterium]|nr:glycosyltransferase family 2 protein [Anaerolineae bacterium]MDW8099181.1 glycosyltransferase family 2 protein [Anaerolineae bacterium]
MTRERPFASVIIPNYNGERFLPTCLDALRAQTYPAGRFEVIVVDDASQDGSLALLQRAYPEVRVLALPRNRGLAAACNAGAAVARGDALVMLNNDTEAEPGWLAALMEELTAHPKVSTVASKLLLFDQREVLHSAGDLYGRDGIPRNRGVWERDQGQYDRDRRIFGGCGGAVAYRRTAWEEAGGFDEQLFMYLEDVDLAWRLRLLGWEAIFAPEARVYHRLSATGGGALASFYTGRNTVWVLARDVPGPILRHHWPAMVRAQLRIAREAARAWRGVAARARLRGQCAGLAGLPRMLAQRSALQARRRVSIESLEALLV